MCPEYPLTYFLTTDGIVPSGSCTMDIRVYTNQYSACTITGDIENKEKPKKKQKKYGPKKHGKWWDK
jgi:hypothetical protein